MPASQPVCVPESAAAQGRKVLPSQRKVSGPAAHSPSTARSRPPVTVSDGEHSGTQRPAGQASTQVPEPQVESSTQGSRSVVTSPTQWVGLPEQVPPGQSASSSQAVSGGDEPPTQTVASPLPPVAVEQPVPSSAPALQPKLHALGSGGTPPSPGQGQS